MTPTQLYTHGQWLEDVSEQTPRRASGRDVLIMLGHTALTPTAVLASERRPDHARDAEMALVVLPLADQLVDDGLLLGDAVELGHEAGVVDHGAGVEEAGEGIEDGEQKVPEPCSVC